jgi:hypothetical protein
MNCVYDLYFIVFYWWVCWLMRRPANESVFYSVLRANSDYFLTDWLAFITKREYVYCAVRVENLYIVQAKLSI